VWNSQDSEKRLRDPGCGALREDLKTTPEEDGGAPAEEGSCAAMGPGEGLARRIFGGGGGGGSPDDDDEFAAADEEDDGGPPAVAIAAATRPLSL